MSRSRFAPGVSPSKSSEPTPPRASAECTIRPAPQGDVGNPAPVREAQQIARLIARAGRIDLDLSSRERLLVRVAGERDPPSRVRSLHQARAVDAPLGAPTPEIRGTREPVQRPLRRREQPRLGSELRFQPDDPRAHAPHASVRRLDLLISAQRDTRAHRKSQALILKLELGAERASGGPRAPVLRPFTRSAPQITR